MIRRHPAYLYSRFSEGGNTFPTTIFVLVSAIQKLCRVVAIPAGVVLYRGLKELDLPDCFLKGDAQGRRGFTEWGFMSTTADKRVALQYSGVDQGRSKAMVMAIRPNAVDRGAYIGDFSQ